MGKTDPAADVHHQQSMVLVPMDTPGVRVERNLPVFGYVDQHGHAEISFTDVRVPVDHLLGEEGGGFAIAQARLGPGRIHHCMRAIGTAERALELMCARAAEREAFGRPLARQGVVQTWIAESRIAIDQARLLTLQAAWAIDRHGGQGRPQADRGDQGGRPPDGARGRGPGHPGARRRRGRRRTPRCRPCGRGCARCGSPTGPTRCTCATSPGWSCASSSPGAPARRERDPVSGPPPAGARPVRDEDAFDVAALHTWLAPQAGAARRAPRRAAVRRRSLEPHLPAALSRPRSRAAPPARGPQGRRGARHAP